LRVTNILWREVESKKYDMIEGIRTQRSAHKLAPDLGTITATLDERFAKGIISVLHPTATHTSPTPNAFK
jgi:hypothetical protein